MNGTPLDPKTATWEQVEKLLPKSCNGYSAKELFENTAGCVAYTYDDLILMPGRTVVCLLRRAFTPVPVEGVGL